MRVQAPTFFGPANAPVAYNQVVLSLTSTESVFSSTSLPTSQTFINAASTLTGTASFENAKPGATGYTGGPLITLNGTPVPEPAALTSLFLGAAVLLGAQRMRAPRKQAGR